jgi:hypothetical protein
VYEIRHGGDRFWSIVLVYAIGESRGGSLMADDLLSLYGNTGPDTEPEIVKALEKIAGKEQIPLLLAKGWNCLTVLAHLGPDAVPDLLSFLREETCSNLINRIKPEYPIDDDKILTLACTRTRCAILTALGAIGDPSAVDDIILWISVEDTAPAALTALGGLKDERVIPLLYNVVKESKDDNRRSLALGSLVSQAKDLDQLEIPQDLVGKLIDILNATHEQSRMHAAQVLGYSDDLTAIPSLIRTLANEYRYSGTKTAFEAAHSLGRIYKFWPEFASGPREAAAIRHYLREEAKNEESSGIVQRALLAAEERSKTLKQQTSLRCTTCDSEKLTKRKVRVGLFKSYRFVVCSNCGVSRNLKNND